MVQKCKQMVFMLANRWKKFGAKFKTKIIFFRLQKKRLTWHRMVFPVTLYLEPCRAIDCMTWPAKTMGQPIKQETEVLESLVSQHPGESIHSGKTAAEVIWGVAVITIARTLSLRVLKMKGIWKGSQSL